MRAGGWTRCQRNCFFEPCSQRHGLFLACGCCQPIYRNFWAFGGLLGLFPGRILEAGGRAR